MHIFAEVVLFYIVIFTLPAAFAALICSSMADRKLAILVGSLRGYNSGFAGLETGKYFHQWDGGPLALGIRIGFEILDV